MKNKREEYLRIIRFCTVGFSNFVIISSTVWIMMHILQKDYIVANICAYAIAIASSFFWNKTWVFKSQEKSWHKELLLYLAAFGCAYSLQFTFLYSMVEFLNMNKYLAQFLGLFIFGATNFIFNKLLTFRKR